jgi:DNA repair exonuclease SbcCD ATPase subunit
MITFRKIRWKNLLSTGNYWTELQLDKDHNTLVVGDNGSGKSTMLDALCFALFSKPFRNINKPQLINSINGKDTLTEVEFDTSNKSYKIVRGLKPNVFEIYCDGELINQDASVRDYQEYLERFVLKFNYKAFTQIVILGSASFTPFMQLSAADRRTIIEDLLDIQIFSTMNTLLKDKMSNNKDDVTKQKHNISLAEQKYNFQKEAFDKSSQDNQTKIQEYEKEIVDNEDVITKLSGEVELLNSQASDLQKNVTEKSDIESRIKKMTKLESQIENNLSKFKKDIGFFQTNDHCPTCRQNISEDVVTSEIGSLSSKVHECEDGLSKIESKLLSEQERLNKISEIQNTIQNLQVSIATKNTTITETNKYIGKLRKYIDDLNSKTTTSELEETQLKMAKDSLNKFQAQLKELLQERTYYEAASSLLKDTGIKTKIVKQYLPIINKLMNKYLSALDFFVNFNLDESFKETIKSRHRDDFSYASFSEGEKQRIDMALLLTWRAVAKLKNSSNTNLLILDEVFDSSLDIDGTENLMRILHMLEDVNLFVISHKGDILQDKFKNVIRFEKVKNFSKII